MLAFNRRAFDHSVKVQPTQGYCFERAGEWIAHCVSGKNSNAKRRENRMKKKVALPVWPRVVPLCIVARDLNVIFIQSTLIALMNFNWALLSRPLSLPLCWKVFLLFR